jgi:hypothetical protein
MKKRLSWFEIALTVVFLSATFYAAFSDAYNLPNRWFIRDDAYYYFKVAQNLSEGHGSTFDGIHITNGYHPLWLLISIPIFALARFDLILPLRVLAILIGTLQVATAVLLYRLIRRVISEHAAILAACYWAFNSYILVFLYKTGVESSIALFLLVLMLGELFKLEGRWRRQWPGLREIAGLGVLATLIVFARLDLIFLALILGVWIVFRASPLRYLLPLDILALVMATVSAFLLRLGFSAYYDVSASVLIMLGASLLVRIPVMYLSGLYTHPGMWTLPRLLRRLVVSGLAGSVILTAALLGGGALGILPSFSRAALLLDAAIGSGAILIIRLGALAFRNPKGTSPPQTPREEFGLQWRVWLKEGAVYYGLVGGILAAYMLWNRIAFGTFTPVSGQIKHWWGTFTHSIYGGSVTRGLTFFALNPFSDFNAWAPPSTMISDWSNQLLYQEGTGFGNPRWQQNFLLVLAICALVVLIGPILKKRLSVRTIVQTAMIPLFVGSWLQIIAYNVTGYASPKEWYWLAEPLLLVLLGALLVKIIIDIALKRWAFTRLALALFIAWYGIRAGFMYWRDAHALSPYGLHSPATPYTPVIPFLEQHTEPGAVIGMTGGGNVGYLMPSRTIVNMDGLINSNEYFLALQNGAGADYLYDTGLRYVFANPTLLASNPYRGQYTDRLDLIVEWGGKDLLRLLPRNAD